MDYMNDVYPLQADLSYLPEIEKIPEIRSVSETAYKPGMVKSDKDVHGVMFKGVDSTYSLDFFADFLTEGTLPDFSGRRMSDQVLISKRLATMLGLSTGDRMTVYFIGEQVRARRLTVTGLYDIQLENLDEKDEKLAVMDIRQIRRLNGWEDHESSCLEIALGGDGGKAADRRRIEVYDEIGEIIMDRDITADAPVVVRRIDEIYPGLFDWLAAPVAVRRIDEIYPGLFDWLALLDLNVLVVMALMMAVAGFNMISGLLIILFERISMIGLLKSLGMRTSNICKVFIYRGGAIVLKGMLWGNAAAVVLLAVQKWLKPFTLNPVNYFVNFVPVELNPLHIITVDIAAFVLMLIIMIIPSLFIARVSPARTIKVS